MTSKGPSRAGSGFGKNPAAPGDATYPRFHGRRRGRPLRKRRSRLVETLLPQLLVRMPEAGTVDLPALFDTPRKAYRLEIGFGAGEHLAWQAAAHPEIGFIGCEAFVNGVASLLRHIDERALRNIRIFDDDARPLLAALAPASIERLFLLHPDPWPKRRHRDRRFVQGETIRRFAELMPPRRHAAHRDRPSGLSGLDLADHGPAALVRMDRAVGRRLARTAGRLAAHAL